jgi:hypothetical protein
MPFRAPLLGAVRTRSRRHRAHSRGPRLAPRAWVLNNSSKRASIRRCALASEALWICARAPFLAPFRAPPLAPFRGPCADHWTRHSRGFRLGPEHTAARRLESIPREPPRALGFAPAVVGARPECCAVSERHPAPSQGPSRRAWRREGCTGPAHRVRRARASRRASTRAQQASLEARGLHRAQLPIRRGARRGPSRPTSTRAQLPVSDVARARAQLPVSDAARAVRAQQASLEARGAAPAQLPCPTRAQLPCPTRAQPPCPTRAQPPCPTWRARPAHRVRRGARGPSSRVRRGALHGPSRRAWRRAGCTGPAPVSDVARARPSSPCPTRRAGAAGGPRRGPSVGDRRAPSEKRRSSGPPSM